MKAPLIISSFLLAGFLGLPSMDTPHKLNSEGNRYFNEGDFGHALEKYEQVIEKNQEDYKAYYNKGNGFYRQGDYKNAIESYEEAIEKMPSENPDWRTYYNHGNAYYNLDNPIAAINSYEEALKLEPNHPDILHNLELARKKLKEQEEESGFKFERKEEKNKQQENQSPGQNQGNEPRSEKNTQPEDEQGFEDEESGPGQKDKQEDDLGMSDRQIDELLRRLEREEQQTQKEMSKENDRLGSIFDENDPMRIIEELEKEFRMPSFPELRPYTDPPQPDW